MKSNSKTVCGILPESRLTFVNVFDTILAEIEWVHAVLGPPIQARVGIEGGHK